MTQIEVPTVGGAISHTLLEELCGYTIEIGTEVVERSDVHLMTTTTDDIERYELMPDTTETYRRTR